MGPSTSARRTLPAFVALAMLAFPAQGTAATLVGDTAGALRLTATAGGDTVTLARVDDMTLRVTAAAAPVAVDPTAAGCTADADGSARCAVSPVSTVRVDLGDGADRLDARQAGTLALTVEGGPGDDHLQVGAGGRASVLDVTTGDTVDLAHTEAGVTVGWSTTDARLVARCDGCPVPWQVVLPASPGRVVTGDLADSVDLRAWRGSGRTTWTLGGDRDRFLGSATRRSVADAGDGWDTLVSYAPADVLRGGAGYDKLVDFGGLGDVLLGGPETDSLASLDARRDTLDGQGGRDVCLTRGLTHRWCDSGPVRAVETSLYHPLSQPYHVLRTLAIVL